ncbi:MAG: hypothetical protein KDI42_06615 [Gammaproteobacteria bacterium]|nr:hypothetical protein [Gammaproteobacteria bacterium]
MNNTPSASTNEACIEDIERAAWFARLAFGDLSECQEPRPTSSRGQGPAFEVIP